MPKHYAITDIHGMYNIYEQVNNMLGPEDVVYFLGDAGDRGYDGFKCIKAIYENPQWIYIKGNHEDMMVKSLQFIVDSANSSAYDDFGVWMYNGGSNTYDGWIADGSDPHWITRLKLLPLIKEYTNEKGITFHMTHAGYTCGHKEQMWGEDLLWSRSHFKTSWDEEFYKNDICIHGHTPIKPFIKHYLYYLEPDTAWYDKDNPTAKVYCNGHKINIDNGAFFTNVAILYDLDEMKSIPIYDKHSEEQEDE